MHRALIRANMSMIPLTHNSHCLLSPFLFSFTVHGSLQSRLLDSFICHYASPNRHSHRQRIIKFHRPDIRYNSTSRLYYTTQSKRV